MTNSTKTKAIFLAALALCATAAADQMELRRQSDRTWQVTVTMNPAPPLKVTGFTTLFWTDNFTNKWRALAPVSRIDSTRVYVVTNGASAFFRLETSRVR